MGHSQCIYCASPLTRNPLVPHWRHCPSCEPEWHGYVESMGALVAIGRTFFAWSGDRRGTPTINGVRK